MACLPVMAFYLITRAHDEERLLWRGKSRGRSPKYFSAHRVTLSWETWTLRETGATPRITSRFVNLSRAEMQQTLPNLIRAYKKPWFTLLAESEIGLSGFSAKFSLSHCIVKSNWVENHWLNLYIVHKWYGECNTSIQQSLFFFWQKVWNVKKPIERFESGRPIARLASNMLSESCEAFY